MTGHGIPGVAPHPGQPLALTWVTMRLKFGGVVESFWPGSEIEMVSVSHLIVARKACLKRRWRHFGNYSPSVKRLPGKCLALCTSPCRTPKKTPSCRTSWSGGRHRRHRTHLPRQVRRLLLVCAPAPLRDWFGWRLVASLFESGRTGGKYSHRNSILAMVSRVRTAESNQNSWRCNARSTPSSAETLECYDDGAIEEEELAAFGLVLELFNHAIVERRAALQAGTSNRLAARR